MSTLRHRCSKVDAHILQQLQDALAGHGAAEYATHDCALNECQAGVFLFRTGGRLHHAAAARRGCSARHSGSHLNDLEIQTDSLSPSHACRPPVRVAYTSQQLHGTPLAHMAQIEIWDLDLFSRFHMQVGRYSSQQLRTHSVRTDAWRTSSCARPRRSQRVVRWWSRRRARLLLPRPPRRTATRPTHC